MDQRPAGNAPAQAKPQAPVVSPPETGAPATAVATTAQTITPGSTAPSAGNGHDHGHLHDGATERDHGGGAHLHDPQQRARMKRDDIPGWGADLDHANRPAYPKERMPPRLDNVHWTQPEDQPLKMTVFHSTERPGVTPVFGTSAPPKGLSGKLRGAAYAWSENDIRHWLMLLLADRVNMVEGIGEDLMQGRVPNLLAEMGIASEWKYNRAGLMRKAAIATTVAAAGYYLLRRRRAD